MPLKSGSDRETVSANISEMVKAGHPQEQAVAAALRKSREDSDEELGMVAMGHNPNVKDDAKKRADWEDLGPGESPAEKAERERNEALRRTGKGGARNRIPGKDPDPTDPYSGYDSKSDASPLVRAEAVLDEQKLMDAADAHADALAARLDAWERKMVRNGEQD